MGKWDQWYAFKAYNSQTLYAYGSNRQAEAYADILNEKREVNVYGAHRLTEAERLEVGLPDCQDAICLDDELAFRIGLR